MSFNLSKWSDFLFILGLDTHFQSKSIMSQPQDRYSPPGSDQLLIWLLSNQSYSNLTIETTMIQEALATTIESRSETKLHSRRIICLEILVSLLFLIVGLLVQWSNKTKLVGEIDSGSRATPTTIVENSRILQR